MKLSFSTLSCPEWTVEKIVKAAEESGYEGVEIRGILGEFDLPKCPEFSPTRIQGTKEMFADAGLEIVCLGTSSSFHWPEKETVREQVESAKRHIDLAQELGARMIRVFGDRIPPETDEDKCIEQVADAIRELCSYAVPSGTTIAQETHGDFSDTRRLAKVAGLVSSERYGALWDIHHPYRFYGEQVEDTYKRIGQYLVHTHFRDCVVIGEEYVRERGNCRSVLIGHGTLPIREILALLKDSAYDGYLSLEWEKAWHPELEEPEVVVPHYAQTMREYLDAVHQTDEC